MKKIIAAFLLPCALIFLFGCGSDSGTKENAELIVGSWDVIGVMYEEEYTALADNEGLADLYDTNWITIEEDGSYSFQNGPFSEEGTWERYENEDLKYAYMLEADDGDKRLAGILEEDTSAMIVYDFSFEEDQVMLVYGKDGAIVDSVILDQNGSKEVEKDEYASDSNDNQEEEHSYNSNDDIDYSFYDAPTSGEERALQRARDYLEYSAFSYSGLIDQLEFEGFTTAEATYAVDHCGADWYEQAAKKAQDYLDYASFSRSGLIDQLEFEGFTYDQAAYGAEAVY